MIIKRSIRFILKKQKKSNSRIIMRVAYIGKSMDFQTGIVVDERNFDKKSQCLTGCTLTSSEVIIAYGLRRCLSKDKEGKWQRQCQNKAIAVRGLS